MIFSLIEQLRANPSAIAFAAIVGAIFAMLFALCVHEFGHAYAATKAGDATPKGMGRLTLNPAKHLDLVGTLMLVFGGFGWAKPVPVNPNNFTHPRKGMFWTSAAGVITNYIMAFISFAFLVILQVYVPIPSNILMHIYFLFLYFFYFMYYINLALFLFNLLPIHPLDGFRLLETLTRTGNKAVEWLRKNGLYVLIALLILGYIANRANMPMLDLLGTYLNYGSLVIGWPIEKFWGLFF